MFFFLENRFISEVTVSEIRRIGRGKAASERTIVMMEKGSDSTR